MALGAARLPPLKLLGIGRALSTMGTRRAAKSRKPKAQDQVLNAGSLLQSFKRKRKRNGGQEGTAEHVYSLAAFKRPQEDSGLGKRQMDDEDIHVQGESPGKKQRMASTDGDVEESMPHLDSVCKAGLCSTPTYVPSCPRKRGKGNGMNEGND